MTNAIQLIEQTVYGLEAQFNAVAVDKSVSFKREAEFALQIICGGGDYIRKIAAQNSQSVRDAVTNVAAIGISLNPAKKQAYLVPRKGGIVLQISWMGLIDLAVECGSILWGKAEIVRDGDTFEYRGMGKEPLHQFNPFDGQRLDREILGAYCVAKTRDGDYLTEMMAIDEINAIRDRSDAWKSWVKDKKPCPWVTDPLEMQKKTVVRRGSKSWPRTSAEHDRVRQAVHYMDTEGGEGVTFDNEQPQPVVEGRANWIGQAALARSVAEMTKISKAGAKFFNEAKDREGFKAFAEAVQRRGAELRKKEAQGGVIDV